MYILGIESSCDETAIAIVENGKTIHSNVIYSQIPDHQENGGVWPELAARKHLENINDTFDKVFDKNININQIDKIAVVNEPGMIGCLHIGIANAKVFSFYFNKDLIGINHIYAHLYAPHLEYDSIPFPNIGVVASGGHTLIFYSKSPIQHILIGQTVNDAIGESFDKIAKYFNLGYPGGPVIDNLAKKGNANAYKFPKASLLQKSNKKKLLYNFSYSGLKTAVIHQRNKFLIDKKEEDNLYDILASFQKTAIDSLIDHILLASKEYKLKDIVITGGVSANSYFRDKMKEFSIKSYFASPKLSTDNAAMVAGLAYHYFKSFPEKDNKTNSGLINLNFAPKSDF